MRFYLPSWTQCLILVVIFFVGSVAASAIFLSGIESSSLTYAATMVLPLLWAFLISRRNQAAGYGFVPLDEPRSGRFNSMFPVFAIVIVATPFLAALIEPLTALFPMSDVMRAAFEKMFDSSRPVDTFIAASILAPLCEELLCRGLICRGLLIDATYASVIPQPWYTIFLIISALITAASIYLIYRNYKDDQSIISFEIRPASSGEAMGRECPEE